MSVAPKKFYGQHFLRDTSVLDTIMEEANIVSGDVVVEIGPGEGALTERLLRSGARVFAVEVDDEAVTVLQKRFAGDLAVCVVHADVLRVSPSQWGEWLGNTPWKLIANIPYNITGEILRRFLIGEQESVLRPSHAILLVQKEVADRAVAGAGAMNRLALGLQIGGQVRRGRIVPPGAFFPPPAVQSALLIWLAMVPPYVPASVLTFATPAFLAPRKKMSNTLAPSFGGAEMFMRACERAGVSTDARPEALSVAQWVALYEAWYTRPNYG